MDKKIYLTQNQSEIHKNSTMNEDVQKLYESSWSRVLQWMENYDIVTITAFRSVFTNGTERCNQAKVNNGIEQGHVFSKGENLMRNRTLKQLLISYGYGVTTIYGNHIEGANGADAVEVGEQSFFVVNLPNDKNFYRNVFVLSEVFDQDSFLYKPKDDSKAYLVGTNLSDFPGYGNEHTTGTLTSLPSRFMSRIKNAAFAFVNKDNWIVKNKKSDISSDEMNDYSNDYSWREDERPTFNARKAERMEHEALAEDWRKLTASNGIMLESIEDLSRNAKMALIGITEEINPSISLSADNRQQHGNKKSQETDDDLDFDISASELRRIVKESINKTLSQFI